MISTLFQPLQPPVQVSSAWVWTKRILLGIVFAVWLFFLFIFAALAADRAIGRKEIPSVFGFSPLIVLSGSMEPEIYKGDLVIIQSQEGYGEGDIVTYLTPAADGSVTSVTHRIIDEYTERGVRYFITKGDNNDSADPNPVRETQVVGEVVAVIPDLGTFLEWLKTPSGIISVILFACIIIAAAYIIKA